MTDASAKVIESRLQELEGRVCDASKKVGSIRDANARSNILVPIAIALGGATMVLVDAVAIPETGAVSAASMNLGSDIMKFGLAALVGR